MPYNHSGTNPDKVGWRVNEWADDVGIGRAFCYQLISEKKIQSVKLAGARIIITPPREYLRSLAEAEGEL